VHGRVGPALWVCGLSAAYGRLGVLEGVSFELASGELVALVGPNGAGKSTLLRCVLGLHPHDGRVALHGRREVAAAYVPQRSDVDLEFPITVNQVVAAGRRPFRRLARRPRATDRQAVAGALALVELDGLGGRRIGELSGGQQQRAFIARALAQEPDVLLLDEPLAGIDGATSAELLELLDRLAADGAAVLVTTHDLQLVRRRFERCLLLKRTLLADGPPAEVLRGPALEAALGFTAPAGRAAWAS